jgi:hypothetical protein
MSTQNKWDFVLVGRFWCWGSFQVDIFWYIGLFRLTPWCCQLTLMVKIPFFLSSIQIPKPGKLTLRNIDPNNNRGKYSYWFFIWKCFWLTGFHRWIIIISPLAALNVFRRCRNEKRRKSHPCCQMVENARTFSNFLSGFLKKKSILIYLSSLGLIKFWNYLRGLGGKWLELFLIRSLTFIRQCHIDFNNLLIIILRSY